MGKCDEPDSDDFALPNMLWKKRDNLGSGSQADEVVGLHFFSILIGVAASE